MGKSIYYPEEVMNEVNRAFVAEAGEIIETENDATTKLTGIEAMLTLVWHIHDILRNDETDEN